MSRRTTHTGAHRAACQHRVVTTDPMTRVLELRSTVMQDVDDSGRVLVVNDDSGSMQLSEIDADGRWRRLTDVGEPVSGRYLPGTPRRAVVSVDPSGTERTQLWLLDLDADGDTKPGVLPELQALVHDPDHIHTVLNVAEDTVLYTTNRRDGVEFDIVRRTVSTGEDHVLYDGGGSFNEVEVSHDGTRLVASRSTLVAASSQLLVIDVATGAVEEITDPDRPGDWVHPHWLPDGDVVASCANTERIEVHRWQAASRMWRIELADPDADLVALAAPHGYGRAVVRSCEGSDSLSVHRHDGATVPVPLPGEGVVTAHTPIRWSPDGSQLGFTFSDSTSPPEAFTWSRRTGTSRRSESNDPAALPHLDEPQRHRVTATDGEQVPVFVVRGAEPDGSAVLYVHGGPEAQAALSWNPYVAALALAGHTVIVPNVRGSAGYGRRWLGLDDVEKRLDSVADLAAIHAWLPQIRVDPARVALMGGSYGGYMVLAGLTFHAGLWAAGVDIVGMSSLTTFMENTSMYRRVYREREYGSLAQHRDVLDAASPLPIIDRLAVPLFVIHGRNDPRVPLAEAEQVAAAVRANGAECELLVYDDEGHGLSKRKNKLDAYPRAAAFLARHLA
jgi:dipeptidyl aminopeptidase/acylaminoacyl peptidase